MTWAVELSPAAEKDLKRIPRDRQVRIERAIDEMEENPFAGDVKALQGREWKGRYRKRVGQYRIIFTVPQDKRSGDFRHSPSLREDLPVGWAIFLSRLRRWFCRTPRPFRCTC